MRGGGVRERGRFFIMFLFSIIMWLFNEQDRYVLTAMILLLGGGSVRENTRETVDS